MQLTALKPEILLHVSKSIGVPMHGLVAVIGTARRGRHRALHRPLPQRGHRQSRRSPDPRHAGASSPISANSKSAAKPSSSPSRSRASSPPELKARIEAVLDKTELEDLYLPLQAQAAHQSRRSPARKGSSPSRTISGSRKPGSQPLEALAATFIDAEKGVASAAEALEGARHIVAEWISENADFRKFLRQLMLEEGIVVSRAVDGAVDPEGKFKMYYDYREPAAKIPSHRMLAIRRGAKEEILVFEIELDRGTPIQYLRAQDHSSRRRLGSAPRAGHRRQLRASAQSLHSDRGAARTEDSVPTKKPSGSFATTWRICCSRRPPASSGVLAVDPGIRTGCKLAVVDDTGKVPRARGHLSPRAEERPGGLGAHPARAHRAAQRSRHRHRQRHRLARGRRRSSPTSCGRPKSRRSSASW